MKKIFFTPSNTGMVDNKYPELGAVWKAAHVKLVLWYCATQACKLAEETEVASLCQFWFHFSCIWFQCSGSLFFILAALL